MSLPEFAKWAQMIISGFSGLMLCMFWVHVRKLERKGKDKGFLYLGAGLLVWALLYALELTFSSEGGGGSNSGGQSAPEVYDRFLRRILSLTNSCLFLLTLPFFEHGFRRLHDRLGFFHDPGKWGRIVLPAAVFTFGLTFLTYRLFNDPDQEWIAGLPDGIFSLVAILGLGYAMFISFSKRQLPSLSALTALVLLGLLGVQILDFLKAANVVSSDNVEEVFLLLRMCSHSLLAMLFFALAFTWVIERLAPKNGAGGQEGRDEIPDETENVAMSAGSTGLGEDEEVNKDNLPEGRNGAVKNGDSGERSMVLGRNQAGKYYVDLTWPERNIHQQQIFLSEGKFKYLLLTAVRKIRGEFVHGDKDVRFLYGGNIDTSNSAIKDAFNKKLSKAAAIQDRGELMESRGQGSRQYRLRFAGEEIDIKQEELEGDPATKAIINELLNDPE